MRLFLLALVAAIASLPIGPGAAFAER